MFTRAEVKFYGIFPKPADEWRKEGRSVVDVDGQAHDDGHHHDDDSADVTEARSCDGRAMLVLSIMEGVLR